MDTTTKEVGIVVYTGGTYAGALPTPMAWVEKSKVIGQIGETNDPKVWVGALDSIVGTTVIWREGGGADWTGGTGARCAEDCTAWMTGALPYRLEAITKRHPS